MPAHEAAFHNRRNQSRAPADGPELAPARRARGSYPPGNAARRLGVLSAALVTYVIGERGGSGLTSIWAERSRCRPTRLRRLIFHSLNSGRFFAPALLFRHDA